MSLAQACIGKIIEFNNKQYRICSSNNHFENAISIFNDCSRAWIRHYCGYIIEENKDHAKNKNFFDLDSSFIPKFSRNGIIFQCTNPGLNHLYISSTNGKLKIDKISYAYEFNVYQRPSIGDQIVIAGKHYILSTPTNKKNNFFSLLKYNNKPFKIYFSRNCRKKCDSHILYKIIDIVTNIYNFYFFSESSFEILLENNHFVLKCQSKNLINKFKKELYVLEDDTGALFIGEKGNKALAFFPNHKLFDDYEIILEYLSILQDENKFLQNNIRKQNEIINNLINKTSECSEIIYQSFKNKYILENNKDNIYISVIIPLYNMENYIEECLMSIINQTIANIEIIIIDDGSTDNSYKLANNFAEKDPRIKIIHQQNKGVGFARNAGIQYSNGEYICFIDPDDIYPANNILEKLYVYAKQYNVSISGGEFSIFTNIKTNIVQNFTEEYEGYLFDSTKILQYSDYQFDYGFHRFLYSREMIIKNNIFFPNYKRFQDPPFMVNAMIVAKSFIGVDFISYAYRVSHKKIAWDLEKVNDFINGITYNIKISKQYNYKKLQFYCFAHFLEHLQKFDNNSVFKFKNKLLNTLYLFDKQLINDKYNKSIIEETVDFIKRLTCL